MTEVHLVPHPVEIILVQDGQVVTQRSFQTTPIRIGRLNENDLVVPMHFMSRFHAEFRFDGEQWTVVDLGSKNGLLNEGGQRQKVIPLGNSAKFSIDKLSVTFKVKTRTKASFAPFKERRSGTQILSPFRRRAGDPKGKSAHSMQPLLNVDTKMQQAHPGARAASERALQMSVVWHDQLLETYEFLVGEKVQFPWNGVRHKLGYVGEDKTALTFNDAKGSALNVDVKTPASTGIGSALTLHFRYVPVSEPLPASEDWIDPRFVDPLVTSSAIHLSLAVMSFFAPSSSTYHAPPEVQNHYAHIVVPPSPPEPPAPPPELPPPPVEVVKEEPPPPPPPEEKVKPPPKKIVVVHKKLRKVAITKREDVKKVETPTLAPKKPDAAPVKVEKTAEAEAAKPQPVNVKKIGVLGALAVLKDTPSNAIAGVESIQVSRAPSSESGKLVGAKAVAGTGQIISSLSQSNGGGQGTGTIGIQSDKVKGYSAGGLSGKTGKRKVMGSVLGGATYTELSKNEGLTREQVMAEVQKHQAQFQHCYERGLLDNPDLAGRADLEWQITASGNVTSVSVKATTLKGGENLLDCVQAVFRKMKFPAAKNGEGTTPTIGLPFGRI